MGSEAFRQSMLERMEGKLSEHHAGQLRQEGAQARAKRMMSEELRRLGWTVEEDLARRRKNDPDKLAIATRLRTETTLTLKQIAQRVSLGTSKGAHATLHRWMQGQGRKAKLSPGSSRSL